MAVLATLAKMAFLPAGIEVPVGLTEGAAGTVCARSALRLFVDSCLLVSQENKIEAGRQRVVLVLG